MKKTKAEKKPQIHLPANNTQEEMEEDVDAKPEQADEYSIQEFIELKKLQNRILKKMLEKMNEPEN